MEYEIVELGGYSGRVCTMYSVIPKGGTRTLLEDFINENWKTHEKGVRKILTDLVNIGKELGMRKKFYKPNEGRKGDNIGAMFDHRGPGLRLYFIQYGSDVIIIGGGGYKAEGIEAWQDDPNLKAKMELLIQLSEHIGKRLRNKDDLWWSKDLRYIEGDLKNYEDEEESDSS